MSFVSKARRAAAKWLLLAIVLLIGLTLLEFAVRRL